MIDDDVLNYQTVFAKHPGSVAAPTAGLHLTQAMVRQLVDLGVAICPITLHVGVGTFRPIGSERLVNHVMHSEAGVMTAECAARLNHARQSGHRIIAVGTTSVRVLESAIAPDGQFQAWQDRTDLFVQPGFEFRDRRIGDELPSAAIDAVGPGADVWRRRPDPTRLS